MANPDEQLASQVIGARERIDASVQSRSGVFKLLMDEHGEVFASAKRRAMRADAQQRREYEPKERDECSSHRPTEMEVCAALRAVVQTELSLENNLPLADAMAALDALNPGSPEWGPTFLQLSELVAARVDEDEFSPASDEAR